MSGVGPAPRTDPRPVNRHLMLSVRPLSVAITATPLAVGDE